MKRTLGLMAVTCLVASLAATADSRPSNIILIMADDMGYECVEAYGAQSYKTPHLNALAESGMRFDNAFSNPLCTPSRVKIMSGRYNSRNYVRFGLLLPKIYTFGNMFRAAGYETCVAGKWQLEGGMDGPHRFGFDEYCLWQLTRRPGRYPNPGLEINGHEVEFEDGQYGPDIITDYINHFILRNRDKPFLVYYPMILPHWPFEPTPDSRDWDKTSKGQLSGHGNPEYFDDMVAYTDKMVGKIVRQLDRLGLRESTLVLFTSDNGTARGIQSEMNGKTVIGGKGTPTDAGTQVPLIASQPGRIPDSVSNQDLIDFTDFFPTLAEMAGLEIPDQAEIDGVSFAPQLMGETGNPRKSIYVWYFRNGKPDGQGRSPAEFARTHRYKLYYDGNFFDVTKDPLEEIPLPPDSLNSEQRRIRDYLRGVIQEYTRPGFYNPL